MEIVFGSILAIFVLLVGILIVAGAIILFFEFITRNPGNEQKKAVLNSCNCSLQLDKCKSHIVYEKGILKRKQFHKCGKKNDAEARVRKILQKERYKKRKYDNLTKFSGARTPSLRNASTRNPNKVRPSPYGSGSRSNRDMSQYAYPPHSYGNSGSGGSDSGSSSGGSCGGGGSDGGGM